MQGNIEQAFMLACVGNAYLAGRDVSGFWPESRTFQWTKFCHFRTPPPGGGDSDEYPLKAADPLAWFASLKPWARGLRLHAVEPDMEPYRQVGTTPRMLVGMVGGGPRWLVEAVGPTSSELWQGFDKLGDRNDPGRKIWSTTWILQGTAPSGAMTPTELGPAVAALREVLPKIEAYARSEQMDNFGDCFARSLAALDNEPEADESAYRAEFVNLTGMSDDQLRVRLAINHAWVFGGMGSWNDNGGGPLYDELSEALFEALTGAICGLANSTYRG
jgi:hypothetical protein